MGLFTVRFLLFLIETVVDLVRIRLACGLDVATGTDNGLATLGCRLHLGDVVVVGCNVRNSRGRS